MPDFSEWNESREFVMQKDAKEVLCLISTELNFLYEVFYTKIMAANSGWGVLIRCIAYFGTLVAFILFCLADKDELRRVDVAITFALLAGVFALDVANAVMFTMSDWTNTNDSRYLGFQAIGQGFFPFLVGLAIYGAAMFLFKDSVVKRLFDRLWSEKMGLFNLLSHCLCQRCSRKCRKTGFIWEKIGFIREKLAEMRHMSKKVFNHELWRLVYEDVKNKAVDATDAEKMRRVYDARGDWAIEETGCHDLMPYINGFQYDNTLLIWHVATEICFNLDKDGAADVMKNYSKILSDYMMYLLVKQPKLMSAVVGIGHIRYDQTCLEAKLLGTKLRGLKFRASTMPEFCALILEEHTDVAEPDIDVEHYLHSVLNDACGLVRLLRENNDRWEIMFKVWMEMLEFAAGHCKADSHARLLSEGGEFITFVWMLMAHYGIGSQFPVK